MADEDEQQTGQAAAGRPSPIPPSIAWNARIAAARRMTTEFCEPQHLALEEVTWHAATTLARTW